MIVSNQVFIDRAAIVAAKHLKLICVAATGYNNVDFAAAGECNIPVCDVRGYATPSVVQHVFMLMLNLARHFVEYQEWVKSGSGSGANRVRSITKNFVFARNYSAESRKFCKIIVIQNSPARKISTKCASAWPRWLIRFFCSAVNSAAVLPKSGTKKYGS